jgi:hypothetical protein
METLWYPSVEAWSNPEVQRFFWDMADANYMYYNRIQVYMCLLFIYSSYI